MVQELEGPEKQAIGAIKEAVFEEDDLPDDRDTALNYLRGVKREVLAGSTNSPSEEDS